MSGAGSGSGAAVKHPVGFFRPAQLRRASRRICGFWDGVTDGMQQSVFQGASGISQYAPHAFNDDAGYNDNTFSLDASNTRELATVTNISPSFPSTRMPSALPTPASSSDKRSSKKRPASDNQSSRTTSPQSETPSESTDRVVKRQRNTEAARRYRQRKLDRVSELEEALAAMTKERDDFKLKLARSETEVDVLRRMAGRGNG